MKRVIVHSNYAILNRNGNMLNGVGDVSVKDFLKQMVALKQLGLSHALRLVTSDELPADMADVFLFVDMPDPKNTYYQGALATGKPMCLLAWESGMINPRNSSPECHASFDKIFTYDDTLVDGKRYIKVPYSFDFPRHIPKLPYADRRLCCLIVGNKVSTHPLELYSHRRDAISWFEANHPGEFDLYGQGWRKFVPPANFWQRVVNNVSILNRYFGPKHLSYRGEVDDKLEIYQQYRFAICYENARDLPGYISEKIFDCFFGGCVPVYWGAPNVTNYIPEACFIDKRKFETHADLYAFLHDMDERTYNGYLSAIEDFVDKSRTGIFSVDYFAQTIIDQINAVSAA